MNFSPSDYARIIGITSAPDGYTTSLPSSERTGEMAVLHQRIHDHTVHLSGRFYDEFASQYLPSFLRTYFNTAWDLGSEFFDVLSNSLLSVASGISFARFFRENLDEVESFLVVHLRRLDDEFHRVFLALDLPDADPSFSISIIYDPVSRRSNPLRTFSNPSSTGITTQSTCCRRSTPRTNTANSSSFVLK
ncbi:hypothetical protein BDY24DRAFT_389149 [Mrakia frigida]|uniref:uncharacterized protein n=1 Tax=Mrakia frigida TaxID=29902 RepID=UPI003FCBF28C